MQNAVSEDHLVDLLDDLHIAMLVFDENLLLTSSSDAAIAMDGRSKAEVIGELAWHLWPAWESSEIGKALSEAIETRKPRTVRFRFASKHNSFWRSEEHTSELQSLMRTSSAVFCLN